MISDSTLHGKRATWARFRRLAWSVSATGIAAAATVLLYLRWTGSPMPWQVRLAIGLGVALSFSVAGVLMGLLFTSSRSGHDAATNHRDNEE